MTRFEIVLGLLLGCAWPLACGQSVQGGDTQTNWLQMCTTDAECGDLACICGRCSKTCSAASDCAGTPAASCQPADGEAAAAVCGAAEPSAMCLSACDGAAACASGEQCTGGACVPAVSSAGNPGDFCPRYVAEYAEYMERCGCGAVAAERFSQQNLPNCDAGGYFDTLTQAVLAGNLIYDAAAADALFARLDEPDPLCVEEPFRALELDSLEVYSWAGVFTGTRELGAPCTMPIGSKGGVSDCREGVCAGTEEGSGVCVQLVGIDQECDASGDENLDGASARVCFERRASDSDGEYQSAFDSLSCAPVGPGGTRICARDLGVGEECDGHEACASGFCESVDVQLGACAAKRADGEECSSSVQCLSGSCQQNAVPPVCGAPLADGESCVYDDAACESGACVDDGSGGLCGPAPTQAIGESCAASSECLSYGHGDSRGGVCFDGSCWADVCANYLE